MSEISAPEKKFLGMYYLKILEMEDQLTTKQYIFYQDSVNGVTQYCYFYEDTWESSYDIEGSYEFGQFTYSGENNLSLTPEFAYKYTRLDDGLNDSKFTKGSKYRERFLCVNRFFLPYDFACYADCEEGEQEYPYEVNAIGENHLTGEYKEEYLEDEDRIEFACIPTVASEYNHAVKWVKDTRISLLQKRSNLDNL